MKNNNMLQKSKSYSEQFYLKTRNEFLKAFWNQADAILGLFNVEVRSYKYNAIHEAYRRHSMPWMYCNACLSF